MAERGIVVFAQKRCCGQVAGLGIFAALTNSVHPSRKQLSSKVRRRVDFLVRVFQPPMCHESAAAVHQFGRFRHASLELMQSDNFTSDDGISSA